MEDRVHLGDIALDMSMGEEGVIDSSDRMVL